MLLSRTSGPRDDWMQRESVAMSERERMKVLAIAWARLDVVKIGFLLLEMRRREDLKPMLIHTGRHDDSQRSDRVFAELGCATGRNIERVLHRRMLLPMQSVGQVADPRVSAAAC